MPCFANCNLTPTLVCAQGKLGLDRGIRLENLTLGHFVSGAALDRLCEPSLVQFVKHLQARAQVSLRAKVPLHHSFSDGL